MIPYSTGQGDGWLVTYDVDGMSVYDEFVIENSTHGEYRVNRSKMPYRDYANRFEWDVYGVDTSKAKRIANSFVTNFNTWMREGYGLYICSEANGSGKTYLACCLGMEIAKRYAAVLKFTSVTNYVAMLRDKDPDAKVMRECQLLILDDLGAQSEKQEWISEALFHLVNTRVEKRLPTIYTSNMGIKQSSKNDRTFARINASSHELKLPEFSVRDMKAKQEKEAFLKSIGGAA